MTIKSLTPQLGYLAIWFILGFIWLRSGIEKITGGKFAPGLGKTLEYFANGTPQTGGNPYPWFKSFLLHMAIPQSQLIGMLVQWSEIFVGISLIALVIGHVAFHESGRIWNLFFVVPLSIAFMMNLIFWLAAGWTGASTETVNLFMLLVEAVGVVVALAQFLSLKS